MTSRQIKRAIGHVAALIMASFVVFTIAYYVIDPNFSAKASRNPDGSLRIDVKPNFIVRSVYEITVTDATGTIAQRFKPREGDQFIEVATPTAAGTTVTVTCMLQNDRGVAACITTAAKTLIVP